MTPRKPRGRNRVAPHHGTPAKAREWHNRLRAEDELWEQQPRWRAQREWDGEQSKWFEVRDCAGCKESVTRRLDLYYFTTGATYSSSRVTWHMALEHDALDAACGVAAPANRYLAQERGDWGSECWACVKALTKAGL